MAATEPNNYLWRPLEDVDRVPELMTRYLLQQSLCDEWYRVFVGEKRLGLGVGVAITCLFGKSYSSCIWTSFCFVIDVLSKRLPL